MLGSQQPKGEKMPVFDTPSDWWVSLANLTEWLYWPAISALVAGMAWWRTGNLANRANRREQRKDVIFTIAAARVLDEAVTTYEICTQAYDEGPQLLIIALSANEYNVKRDYIKSVNSIDISKFPTALTYGNFVSGKHYVNRLYHFYANCEENKLYPNIEEAARLVLATQDAIKSLRVDARGLSTANEWARLYHQTPPYSWEALALAIKSLPARLRARSAALLLSWRRQKIAADTNT